MAEKRLDPSPYIIDLSNRITDASDTNDFLITGGNVIDPFVQGTGNLNDVDVVFETTTIEPPAMMERLSSQGFALTEMRPYYIESDHEVTVTTATKNQMTLDIVFVDDRRLAIGPLDSESMYYDPTASVFVDAYDCLGAIDRGLFTCIPLKGFDNENPYIIASRALSACAKYDASVLAQRPTIFDEFNERKRDFPTDSDFALYTHTGFPKKVLKAILKSKPQSRINLATEILEADILTGTSDQTNRSLENILGKEAGRSALIELTTATELHTMIRQQA